MESPEELTLKLRELCRPGVRDQLIAKGLARGMIWELGELPEGSPNYPAQLTNDLLNHGYLVLGCAIRLRTLSLVDSIPDESLLDEAFRTAAECIEAVVRRGERSADRGFHLTIAAAAFHLAHFGARSFSLIAENTQEMNLAAVEIVLVSLMQRRLDELQSRCLAWLEDERHSDEGIARLLEAANAQFNAADAAYVAICRVFHRGIASFEFALRSGDEQYVVAAIELLEQCIEASAELRHVPLWWICVLARHLIDDLWGRSLHRLLPTEPSIGDRWPELRRDFIELLCRRRVAEVDLWPSQISAAKRVVDESDSLVVALPTSSGKTRIAELCILKCVAGGRRVIYVTPLRALSAQVEVTLSRTFKPLGFSVSSVYGASGIAASDVDTMASADIVVATPEKLDFAIRQDPDVIDDVGLIVLDEGHMIGLSEREIRYEVLVQRLLRRTDATNRRIVCLSAIFTEGDAFNAFTQWIRSDEEGEAIRSQWRPTRQRPATLEWKSNGGWLEYRVDGETVFVPRFIESRPAKGRRKNAFPQDRSELIPAAISRFRQDGHSVLVYCPMRKSVEPAAESLLKMVRQGYVESFLSDDSRKEIGPALRIGAEWLGDNHVAMQALRVGIAVHHGQLPRPFLAEIERLLRSRVLSVAISSPTLAQGVDLSFSVLIFTSLWRNQKLLPPKEFANVIGRVGRAFVDLDGIFLLPVFESDAGVRTKRLNEFHQLVRDARGRELESGLYLLIFVCLIRLKQTSGLEDSALEEYVLNQQSAIDEIASGDDDNAKQMEVILAELDAGIFSLVEDLDCDVTEIASKLDGALQHSLWRRRLAVRDLVEQVNQTALLHGRAKHIWGRTTARERKGFFSASIGTESGLIIVEQADELRDLLDSTANAIVSGNQEELAAGCCSLAERLFEIYPFHPSMPSDWDTETWNAILEAWVTGATLYRVTDSVGIAFVQEALVFRLVWAIEAVRTVLAALDAEEGENANDDERTVVALCVTYGVPSIAAARLLECGMESRLLAVRLAKELKLVVSTRDDILLWLMQLDGREPIVFSHSEREAWQQFTKRNDASEEQWSRRNVTITCSECEQLQLESGTHLRLLPSTDGVAELYTPDFQWVGRTNAHVPVGQAFAGIVERKNKIHVSIFGPPELPD